MSLIIRSRRYALFLDLPNTYKFFDVFDGDHREVNRYANAVAAMLTRRGIKAEIDIYEVPAGTNGFQVRNFDDSKAEKMQRRANMNQFRKHHGDPAQLPDEI